MAGGAKAKKDVKNANRTRDIVENKGKVDKVSCEKLSFPQAKQTIFEALEGKRGGGAPEMKVHPAMCMKTRARLKKRL